MTALRQSGARERREDCKSFWLHIPFLGLLWFIRV